MSSTTLKDWIRFEGVQLGGKYGLQKWLGDSGNAAFFRTAYGPNGTPALLKLILAQTIDGGPQLELWGRIGRLSHPNVLSLLDFGQCEHGGDSFLYAVFEFPEETLATALERAPLDEAEAREVRQAASDALRYIHSQGLVHGAVNAGHIVAVGNEIKLASDTICNPSQLHTAAGELEQLDRLLGNSAPPSQPPAPAPLHVSPPQPRSFPVWAYAAIVVILGTLGYLLFPKPGPPPARATTPSPPQTVPIEPKVPPDRAPDVAPPAETQSVEAQPPATQAPAAQAPAAQLAATGREYWRVIAYTYASQRMAERRVDAINQKWPNAGAEVFTPDGHSPYLVALGGRMDRDSAVRLLKIAHGKGLPRDIYIQNYSR
jgi:eukaryotic-like serine/threonine-protein kinase